MKSDNVFFYKFAALKKQFERTNTYRNLPLQIAQLFIVISLKFINLNLFGYIIIGLSMIILFALIIWFDTRFIHKQEISYANSKNEDLQEIKDDVQVIKQLLLDRS